jgi:hypothetical protein
MAGSLISVTRNLLVAAAVLGAALACATDAPKNTPTGDTTLLPRATAPAASAGAAAGPSSALEAPAFVGLRYEPLPKGISYEGGAVLMGPDGKPSHFALTHVLTPRGNYMWLDSIQPNDGQNQILSRVVRAELHLHPAVGNETLLIGSCEVKGKLDPAVVAFAERAFNARRLTKIHEAWRADVAAGRFDSIPAKDVVCEVPGG